LDDYEEGTWTPVLSDGINNATSGTAIGYYNKIGDRVYANCYLTTTTLGSVSGNIRITGLPFTNTSTGYQYGAVNVNYGDNFAITAGYSVTGYIEVNVSYILLYTWGTAAGVTPMTGTQWSADGLILLNANYKV
jgi:hypothetical protein